MNARRAVVIALVLFWGSVASAQTRDPVAAEALFQAGRKAFERGDYAIACDKFAESQRLDPGAGTLINLAACREQNKQLAMAWEAWQEALRSLPPGDERRPQAERRASALERRVPRLTLDLASGAPDGTRVFRDGEEVGKAALGVAVPVELGAHAIEVRAPHRQTRRYDVELAEGGSAHLNVEPGAEEPEPAAAPPPAPLPRSPSATPTRARPKPEVDAGRSHGTRTLGFVLGGVGAAGLVVGGVAGVLALERKHTMNDDCTQRGGTSFCGPAGLDAASSGKTLATVSTIGFAAGALALGVGVYFVLSSDGAPRTTLSGAAVPGGGAFRLTRAF